MAMETETVGCDLCEGTGMLDNGGTWAGAERTCHDCDGAGRVTPEFGAFAMPFVRMMVFEPPPEERRMSCHDCKGAGIVHPIVQLANGAWERIPDAFPLRMRCATCAGTGWIEECPYCHGAGVFPEGDCGGCQGLGWV